MRGKNAKTLSVAKTGGVQQWFEGALVFVHNCPLKKVHNSYTI